MKYDNESSNRYTYGYGSNGQAAEVKDTNLSRITRTEFDLSDRPCKVEVTDLNDNLVYRTQLKYDKRSNLHSFTEKLPSETHTTTYTYDNDNRITNIAYDGASNKVAYTYDSLGRVNTRAANSYTTTFGYVAGGHGTKSTTPLVASISQPGMNFSYTYDNRGNIISETRNGVTTSYEYDGLGQLTRVNDPHENATWVYNYDRGGNIASKVKYAYTTGTLGTAHQTIYYTYGDTNWKDKLTAYNGATISYDAIGNPTNDGTWNYVWNAGRQLKQMSKTGTTINFKYNHNGLRTQKSVTANGVTTTTNYTYHGKLVTHMTRGSDTLHFFYDSNSRPAFVKFNGSMYRYVHNLQGDIVGIIDSNNSLVVEYKYSTWGKPYSITGSMASTLGAVNPFLYRGYVYDTETGFYYLRSRYYSPIWARFLNSDNLACINICDLPLINNLFRYALLNPICGYDPDGNVDWWGVLKGVGRAITGVVAAATGIVTCIAGAPIATLIIAGITITAGALTLVNGVADVQQSLTGNNFVRDTVFQGNQNNYDVYASITEGIAIIGGSKCGMYLKDNCIMQGAVPGTTSKVQLQPGEQYIRYGSDYGRYMTTPGTAASSLALPPSNTGNLTMYEVAKAFYADTGIVAPCQWGAGGGTQFFSWRSMQRLIQMGYIVKR